MKKAKFFEKNEGKADRILRALIGAVFLWLGYAYSPWLYIIAAIALITAIDGFCRAYKLLGISTLKK